MARTSLRRPKGPRGERARRRGSEDVIGEGGGPPSSYEGSRASEAQVGAPLLPGRVVSRDAGSLGLVSCRYY